MDATDHEQFNTNLWVMEMDEIFSWLLDFIGYKNILLTRLKFYYLGRILTNQNC